MLLEISKINRRCRAASRRISAAAASISYSVVPVFSAVSIVAVLFLLTVTETEIAQ